jgi:hypothetical protein
MNRPPWRYGVRCLALGYVIGSGAAAGGTMSREGRTFLIGWPIAIFVLEARK